MMRRLKLPGRVIFQQKQIFAQAGRHRQISTLVWPLYGTTSVPDPSIAGISRLRSLFQKGIALSGTEQTFNLDDSLGGASDHGEIMFAGKSNSGKSTLLNALGEYAWRGSTVQISRAVQNDYSLHGAPLLGDKDGVAGVSRQPGRTKHLAFYGVGGGTYPRFVVVDSPGYGFARAPKAFRQHWQDLLASYMQTRSRAVLRRVVLLVAADQPLGEDDEGVIALCEAYGAPYMVVLTKADKVSHEALGLRMRAVEQWLQRRTALAYPVLHAVSARTGAGVVPWFMSLAHAAGAEDLPGVQGKAAQRAREEVVGRHLREQAEMRRVMEGREQIGGYAQDGGEEDDDDDADCDDQGEVEEEVVVDLGQVAREVQLEQASQSARAARLAARLRDPMLAEVAAGDIEAMVGLGGGGRGGGGGPGSERKTEEERQKGQGRAQRGAKPRHQSGKNKRGGQRGGRR